MGPQNTPKPPVAVEYDCRGGRASREFRDEYAARRFYSAKAREGKNPKVKRVER